MKQASAIAVLSIGLLLGPGSQPLTAAPNQPPPQPVVLLSPPSLTFSTQLLGTMSAPKTVTLTNTGTENLDIVSFVIPGASAPEFYQTNNCGSVVPPGGSCTINLSFQPTGINVQKSSLIITDNASNSPQKESLQGTGTEVELVPSALSFGSVALGQTSSPMTVTLTNVNDQTLNITSIKITGKNTGDFAETNNCGSAVGGGNSCTITVTFTPAAKGPRGAAVSITDNGGGSPQKVNLTGTGT